jgi:hypothetical protein
MMAWQMVGSSDSLARRVARESSMVRFWVDSVRGDKNRIVDDEQGGGVVVLERKPVEGVVEGAA